MKRIHTHMCMKEEFYLFIFFESILFPSDSIFIEKKKLQIVYYTHDKIQFI